MEGGIWEDEDARNFYENLIDLKAFVPAILFKDNEKSQNKESNKDEADKERPRDARFPPRLRTVLSVISGPVHCSIDKQVYLLQPSVRKTTSVLGTKKN